MKPYYADAAITLWHGDALEVLRTLPDRSVDCCVTSPPYYGLRDYGTGTWDGGDPGCDHKRPVSTSPLNANFNERWGNSPGQHKQEEARPQSYRNVCGKCGAQRVDHQYGLEESPAAYVEVMRQVFAEVRRVLADDGTLWLNIGDSYASGPIGKQNGQCGKAATDGRRVRTDIVLSAHRPVSDVPSKNLLGIPWRTAFALQDDGWILRNAIVWNKPNAMPESVTDRLSSRHELIFLFAKSRRYWFDLDPIREPQAETSLERSRYSRTGHAKDVYGDGITKLRNPVTDAASSRRALAGMGRNPGDCWTIPTQPFPGAHFAVFPIEIPRRAIQAGCKPGGTVLDPFSGSGTTGLAAGQLGRRYFGIDLNADYLDMSLRTRLAQTSLMDGEVS
jgi:DNA modification methylase